MFKSAVAVKIGTRLWLRRIRRSSVCRLVTIARTTKQRQWQNQREGNREKSQWTLRELNELAASLSHQVSGPRHAKSQFSSRSSGGPFDSHNKHQSFARDAR